MFTILDVNFASLIQRIMDEYEQDLRILEEKHQQGLYSEIPCINLKQFGVTFVRVTYN